MTDLPYVHLRALELEDLDFLYQIENDQSLWRLGVTNMPYSRYALQEYIVNVSGDIFTDKQLRLIIENRKHEIVGIIDLADFNPRHRRAEVGLVVKEECRGMGYGHAAVLRLQKYAKEILHLHQIYAMVEKNNAHSMKVFQDLGFQDIACFKEWLCDGDTYRDVQMMTFFL